MIWLTLTPGAGRSSKRVITGPGCTATTSASTPKSLQLELDQARHRLERLVGIGLLARPRLIEQATSAGSSLDFGASNSGTWRSRSTRSLFSGMGAGASMRGGGAARDLLLLLAHHFLARLLALLPGGELAPLLALRASPVDASQHPGPDLVHDLEPRDAQEERDAREPQPEQQQVAPRKLSPRSLQCPTSSPSTPPAVLGSPDPSQCKVARPQLVSSVSTKPAARSIVLMRERASGSGWFLCTSQPA